MLKVWIPGTTDLRDQGLSGIEWQNHNVDCSQNGKLGKCLGFGSSKYLSANMKIITSDIFTISVWIYAKDVTNHKCIMCCRNATNKSLAMYVLNSASSGYLRIDNGTNWVVTYAVPINTWTHIAYTNNGNNQKIYINGNLYSQRTSTIDLSTITNFITVGAEHVNGNSIGTYFNGNMNDFRIYDTALSPREIKEISKGLVCHYTLGTRQPKNLINKNTLTNDYYINSSGELAATSGWFCTDYISVKPNTAYIASSISKGGSGTYYVLYNASKVKTRAIKITANVNPQFTTTDDEYYVKFSLRNLAGELATAQLEEGSVVTDYEDYLPQWMFEDNIEYDVSGYQNNGTKTNVAFSSDTPKYNGSSYFDGASLIQANPLPSEVKTISVWCKTTKNKSTSQFICQDSASGLCVTFYSGTIITHLGSGYSTGSKCILGDSYIENGWNHFVVLKTGAHTRSVYCNGVQLTPTNNDYYSPSTGFFVGARNASKNLPFYGYISDLRAYTTLLSEEDILELYHTPISLASNGTLLTQGEYVEV